MENNINVENLNFYNIDLSHLKYIYEGNVNFINFINNIEEHVKNDLYKIDYYYSVKKQFSTDSCNDQLRSMIIEIFQLLLEVASQANKEMIILYLDALNNKRITIYDRFVLASDNTKLNKLCMNHQEFLNMDNMICNDISLSIKSLLGYAKEYFSPELALRLDLTFDYLLPEYGLNDTSTKVDKLIECIGYPESSNLVTLR